MPRLDTNVRCGLAKTPWQPTDKGHLLYGVEICPFRILSSCSYSEENEAENSKCRCHYREERLRKPRQTRGAKSGHTRIESRGNRCSPERQKASSGSGLLGVWVRLKGCACAGLLFNIDPPVVVCRLSALKRVARNIWARLLILNLDATELPWQRGIVISWPPPRACEIEGVGCIQ
jgi:hypothetical protein